MGPLLWFLFAPAALVVAQSVLRFGTFELGFMIRSPLSRVTRHQVGGRSLTFLVGGRAAAWPLIVALCIGAASCGLGHSPDLPTAGSGTTNSSNGDSDSEDGTTGSANGSGGGITTAGFEDDATGGAMGCSQLGVGGDGGAQPLDDCELSQ